MVGLATDITGVRLAIGPQPSAIYFSKPMADG